jgi:NDP-sugar pyrophosphorylase family protein
MSLPVAILAGGLARRLGEASAHTPKALIEVAGRPFAEHQIALLRRHGVTRVVFLVGHLGTMIRDTIGDGSRLGVSAQFVFDGPSPLGTGGAIRHALEALGPRFLVVYGDSYLECDYAAIGRAFEASGCDALMTVFHNDNRWDRSNVRYEDGRIVAYDKTGRTQGMQHIDYGLGAFRASAFHAYGPQDAFDLADLYQRLLTDGLLAGYEVPGRFYEIGSPEGLEETRAYLSAALKTP